MQIEFDPLKDAANLEKHGISLQMAADMDLSTSIVIEDYRRDYGERRFSAYGHIGGRLHVLWFTMRGQVVRVIGLRKANDRERRRHDRTIS